MEAENAQNRDFNYEGLFSKQKRSDIEIASAILENIPENGIKITHLANRAMVDYKVLKKYLMLLESEGHIVINGKIYITEKGKTFLEEFKKLKNLITLNGKQV